MRGESGSWGKCCLVCLCHDIIMNIVLKGKCKNLKAESLGAASPQTTHTVPLTVVVFWLQTVPLTVVVFWLQTVPLTVVVFWLQACLSGGDAVVVVSSGLV